MKKVIYWALLTVFLVSSAQAQTSKHSSKNIQNEVDANKKSLCHFQNLLWKEIGLKVEDFAFRWFPVFWDGQAAIEKKEYIYFMKEILSKGIHQYGYALPSVVRWGLIWFAVDYTNFMDNSGVYFGIPNR